MSGRITIDSLSDSLKELIMNSGLSEEEINTLIQNAVSDIDLSGKQDVTDNDLATNNKTIVGAINELFQNANNGKELIANAIGEPLDSSDTFSAMSDDINGLLATFKTNMMNNGVTIESGDKFKALIDKIATLADNEGKGIQYVEGSINVDQTYSFANVSSTHTFNFSSKLDFTPNYIFVRVPGVRSTSAGYGTVDVSNAIITNKFNSNFGNILGIGSHDLELYVQSVNESGFTVKGDTTVNFGDSSYSGYYGTNKLEWCAIGVGSVKEDTTLRDSLAAILQEEGVSVSTTDDMATLIGKVDQEFNRQVVPAGTAVASNVLSGKTFINSTGQLVTGTASIAKYKAVSGTIKLSTTTFNSAGATSVSGQTEAVPLDGVYKVDIVFTGTGWNGKFNITTNTGRELFNLDFISDSENYTNQLFTLYSGEYMVFSGSGVATNYYIRGSITVYCGFAAI